MKIKTKIFLTTTISLIICCTALWTINYFSTHKMMKDIKKLDFIEENKEEKNPSVARLITIKEKEDKNFDRILIGLIFVVTIGGAVTYFAVSYSLKPVKKLTKRIRDFHTSDLKTPIPLPKAKDESYELISSYNIMLNYLNQAFEREKRITASIAHEFKTPLSVLMTACDVLEMKSNPTIEDYKKVVDITKEKAEYLSQITASLLSIHRQTRVLHNEKCSAQEILNKIIEDLTPKATEKNITINLNCPDIEIFCDKLLFSQMINNFVENSIKYNNENGTVNVNIFVSEDNLLNINISDTGIGIEDKLKSLIFEPFFTADDSRNKKYGGVGLGLPFAKVVADLYKGEIKVEDNTPQGTIFTITVPNLL